MTDILNWAAVITVGGQVSATIDANNAANLAEKDSEAEGDGQGDNPSVASSNSGQQDGGSGGNIGNPFNGSGSVAAPVDDYAAGLASYDPSKVGLPDS